MGQYFQISDSRALNRRSIYKALILRAFFISAAGGQIARSFERLRYDQHKARAKRRGIGWEFTFEEWWEIWEPHWDQRGNERGCKVMCRTHDTGPYRPDNVRIDTVEANAAERGLMSKCAPRWNGASMVSNPRIEAPGFKSYASSFLRPDQALEAAQEEYEWIPGE